MRTVRSNEIVKKIGEKETPLGEKENAQQNDQQQL